MIDWSYLSFGDNPAGLAIGVFIVLFAVSMYVLTKIMRDKRGVAVLIAFLISAIATWRLYIGNFYGWEGTLAVVIYIAVAALFIRILWAFVRRLVLRR